MTWLGRAIKDHQASTPPPWAGLPAIRSGCSGPHLTWSWTSSGMRHPRKSFLTVWLFGLHSAPEAPEQSFLKARSNSSPDSWHCHAPGSLQPNQSLYQRPWTFCYPLSSKIKELCNNTNEQGLSFLFLCLRLYLNVPKLKKQVSLNHQFFKIPDTEHCFLQEKYEPETICYFLWNISPVQQGWLLHFLLPLHKQGKIRQLVATRAFSSLYWSLQLPHKTLPERQCSWLQAVLINPP